MKVIVGIGEILWDIFPDGPRFGGAPANFSCSAAELADNNTQVLIVSAVGQDEHGAAALEALNRRHVDTRAVQSKEQPTGTVLVEVDGSGVPSYRFAENTAWDHLTWQDELAKLAPKCDAVCFGTLGQRSDGSRETIHRFVSSTRADALRVLDVNLRSPFFTDDVIRESLSLANVLKLNDEELPRVSQLSNVRGTQIEILQRLCDEWNLRCIALTRGPQGAVLVSDGSVSESPGLEVAVTDTVGAGDAYAAALVLGMLADKTLADINERATEAAAYVCAQAGATPAFPDYLRDTVE